MRRVVAGVACVCVVVCVCVCVCVLSHAVLVCERALSCMAGHVLCIAGDGERLSVNIGRRMEVRRTCACGVPRNDVCVCVVCA